MASANGDFDFHVLARLERSYGCHHQGFGLPNRHPVIGAQHEQRKLPPCQILLVSDTSITRNENIESGRLRRRKQVSIREFRPASLVSRINLMTSQRVAQRRGGVVIQEDSHPRSRPNRLRQALRRVLQHAVHLFARYTGKPFDELFDSRAALQVRKQRRDGHSCSPKQPRSADPLRMPLHRAASCPIQHWVKPSSQL
jgi:hypothetical protein